jgi:ribosomal protein S6--L-glutamate ligase
MILSFHPCYLADENRICAGRSPNEADLASIRAAEAVILPQGCTAELYALVRDNAPKCFPNFDARFRYPGKTDQIRLFRELGAPHPTTRLYASLTAFDYQHEAEAIAGEIGFPLVFKLDFGGEGDTVDLIENTTHLEAHMAETVRRFEGPFLLQQYIPTGQRTLRVVVIGTQTISYWRVNPDPDRFGTSAGKGARIDHEADPQLQRLARTATRAYCAKSGINLAGFDLLFGQRDPRPLFLEINHYFGRRGLGGSEAFYQILTTEIDAWLSAANSDEAP